MQKFAVSILALAATSRALVARGGNCCFHLMASGGASGSVGQLSDGQNRIGGGLAAATYCIDSNGAITDQSNRGCILTPPTTQFQCDTGASPISGFSISSSGTLSYNGNSQFYACQTGDNGEENIYTTTSSAQTGCRAITLAADNCKSGFLTPTPVSPPASYPETCPAALSGTYEVPHLIVPINSALPNTAAGTSYNGEVSSTISSIFNFDIPSSDEGKTCSLVFLFPEQKDLQTSSYTISGSGNIDFNCLSGIASASTSYSNAPSIATEYGSTTVAPGNSYTIATFSCPAGKTISYEMSSSSTTFTYFQDYNPSPIGLYITVC